MILADTSVWADHLRRSDALMAACLEVQEILLHPFVIGELAMGSMPQYDATLASLNNLQQIEVARPDDVLHLIREHRLMGTGIGYVDALNHLTRSDAVLVLGSTEAHYTPSKVFQAMRAYAGRRPSHART